MPVPRFEVPVGVINGLNTVFTVSRPYLPGTTAVFLNGLLQEKSLDDGWLETDPSGGIVTLKEAPRSSGLSPDVVQIFFIDTTPALPETQIFKLRGRLRQSKPLRAIMIPVQKIRGRLKKC